MTQRGVVKWFNEAKGFGFIRQPDGSDVFVHHSQVVSIGRVTLTEGDVVEYAIGDGKGGRPEAQNVFRV